MTEDFYSEIKTSTGAFKWYCAGEWLESTSAKTVAVLNPSTRQKEFEVQVCDNWETASWGTAEGSVAYPHLHQRQTSAACIACMLRLLQCLLHTAIAVWSATAFLVPARPDSLYVPSQACTQQEVDSAFAAAKEAQKAWAKTPLCERAEVLHRVAAVMREHAQPIADCLVKEIAKPRKDSLSEVIRCEQALGCTAVLA
jgi:acyl-CoA reductase-like NAD-dependent aldehyde dehydrogenase